MFLFHIRVGLPLRPSKVQSEKVAKQIPDSVIFRQCNGSGGWPPEFHRGGPGSRPGQPMWDVVDKVALRQAFCCQYHSTGAHHSYLIWGISNTPVYDRTLQTVSSHQHEQFIVLCEDRSFHNVKATSSTLLFTVFNYSSVIFLSSCVYSIRNTQIKNFQT